MLKWVANIQHEAHSYRSFLIFALAFEFDHTYKHIPRRGKNANTLWVVIDARGLLVEEQAAKKQKKK